RDRLEVVRVDLQPPLPPGRRSPQRGDRRSGGDHETSTRERWKLDHGYSSLRLYNHIMSLRPKVIGMYFQLSYWFFRKNAEAVHCRMASLPVSASAWAIELDGPRTATITGSEATVPSGRKLMSMSASN